MSQPIQPPQNGRRGRLTNEEITAVVQLGTQLPSLPPAIRRGLEAHFEPSDIRDYGETSDGKKLSSIDPQAVIARLTDCFAGTWSFAILNYEIRPEFSQVICTVRLTVEFYVQTPNKNVDGSPEYRIQRVDREAIGNTVIKLTNNNGQWMPFNIGWDIKAAVTDGLKKAAMLFGVGQFLYVQHDKTAQTPQQAMQNQHAVPADSGPQMAQEFQVKKIAEFFEKLGYDRTLWMSWFGIQQINQISVDLANAILSGTHPTMVKFQAETKHNINPGLAASNAK